MSLHTESGGFYARDADGRRTCLYLTRAAALAARERLTDAEYAAAILSASGRLLSSYQAKKCMSGLPSAYGCFPKPRDQRRAHVVS